MKPQPTPPPVSSPAVQVTQYPHVGQAPKKRVSIVWVVLGIVGVLIFADNMLGQIAQQTTHVQIGGQQLSQSQLKDSMQEVAQLTKGARAGDPNSVRTGYQPKTELAQRFKALILSAQKINNDYRGAIAEAESPEFLTPHQLGTEQGRKDARRIHKTYVAATLKFEEQTEGYLKRFGAFIQEASGRSLPLLADTQAENAEIAKLQEGETKSIKNLLDFVDRATPGYNADSNKLIFATDNDVAKYRSLVDDIRDAQDALYSRKREILAGRQSRINRATQDLQNRLQS